MKLEGQEAILQPAAWRIRNGSPTLDLELMPNLEDQELHTTVTTGVTYWEGSVSVQGTMSGESAESNGDAELTGYAGEFEGDL